MPDLIQIIKKAAMEANADSMPSGVFFGTVVSAEPLKISVEQKIVLEPPHLILTTNVVDHYVDMTVNHFTEQAVISVTEEETSHSHTVPAHETASAAFDITHNHQYGETGGDGASSTGDESPDTTHSHQVPAFLTQGGGFASDGFGSHLHGYAGRKTFLAHYGLTVGEKVILLRVQGGQRYIVLDRVR